MTVKPYEELRAQLVHKQDILRAELAAEVTRAENGMGYSTHQADDASFATEQAADMAIRRNAERLLYAVEHALTRMDEGVYGLCCDCGQPIDPARLRAIPYARYCMDCTVRHEEH
jgi:DnaK suppressor protein